MTERTIVIVGFVVLLVAVVGAIVISHLRRDLLATLGETMSHLVRTRAAAILAVLTWAWLGWHFLAR